MELTLAGGATWTVVKDGALKQVYNVLDNGTPIAKIDVLDLPLKRTYPIDIADSVDLPVAIGLVWAVNFMHLQRIAGGAAAAAT